LAGHCDELYWLWGSTLPIGRVLPQLDTVGSTAIGSRFESLILSHHSRFTCECNKEEINDDDDDDDDDDDGWPRHTHREGKEGRWRRRGGARMALRGGSQLRSWSRFPVLVCQLVRENLVRA